MDLAQGPNMPGSLRCDRPVRVQLPRWADREVAPRAEEGSWFVRRGPDVVRLAGDLKESGLQLEDGWM